MHGPSAQTGRHVDDFMAIYMHIQPEFIMKCRFDDTLRYFLGVKETSSVVFTSAPARLISVVNDKGCRAGNDHGENFNQIRRQHTALLHQGWVEDITVLYVQCLLGYHGSST
jgi:hypothetical protein